MTAILLGEAIDQARRILQEQGQGEGEGEDVAPDPERSGQAELAEQAASICRVILGRGHFPNQPEAQRLLGLSLRRLGDWPGAERAFGNALASDPRDAAALWELGLLAEERGDQERALAYVQAAWEIDPWRREWRRRVIALSQAIYGAEGRLQLTRAALASIYDRAGLWERVVDECAGVVSELGERLDVQLLMATALFREGRLSWAAASCRDLLDRAPNAVDALLLLAEIERRQGNLSEAGWLRERAFTIDPAPERVASLLKEAGDESAAFFRPPVALIELVESAAEPEPVVTAASVDVVSQTEDRLIAFEHLAGAGDIPELVELPQVSDSPPESEVEPPDLDVVMAMESEEVAATWEPTGDPDYLAPPVTEPEDRESASAEPLFEATWRTDMPPDALDADGAGEPEEASRLELVVELEEAVPSLETEGDVVDASAAGESDDVFAPWIPPAMVAPPQLLDEGEGPASVDNLPELDEGEGEGPASVDNLPELDEGEGEGEGAGDTVIEDQPEADVEPAADVPAWSDEPAPAVETVADESTSAGPEGELERLRRRYRETPELAEEIAAGLEAFIARSERSLSAAETAAAHRLLGSIYRKQGKAALASRHYQLSLTAARKRG